MKFREKEREIAFCINDFRQLMLHQKLCIIEKRQFTLIVFYVQLSGAHNHIAVLGMFVTDRFETYKRMPMV